MRALLPSTSRRTNIPETDVPPLKRAYLTTPAPAFKVEESSAAGAARQPGPTKVTELDTTVRQRTDKFEVRFEEAQDDQALLRARVNCSEIGQITVTHLCFWIKRRCMLMRHRQALRKGVQP
uniref:Uncharacterized protein n=1 Tax=Tanacetum cinerariifolium TaxID=118510 RepID=A0A699UFQ7_TANCI|nr:hypothetical protein [Tanacetum cinerariifolium]